MSLLQRCWNAILDFVVPDEPQKDPWRYQYFSKNGRRIGVLASLRKDEYVIYGFAKCSKADKFNLDHGKRLARQRATVLGNESNSGRVPIGLIGGTRARIVEHFKRAMV